MIRALVFIALVAVAIFSAIWVSEQPGAVSLTWQGWRIDTSAAFNGMYSLYFGDPATQTYEPDPPNPASGAVTPLACVRYRLPGPAARPGAGR